jgi:hypothetical protein
LLMDSLILILAQNMPIQSVAEIIGEHDTRIWRVLSHYIPESRSGEDHSQVKVVGVDETSCAKFHKYISLFEDSYLLAFQSIFSKIMHLSHLVASNFLELHSFFGHSSIASAKSR